MTGKPMIAAVGAGRMGRGIALTFALSGYPVRLMDIKARDADGHARLRQAAMADMTATLDMLAGIGLQEAGDRDAVMARIGIVDRAGSGPALNEADVVFEGVPETLEAKREAFAFTGAHVRPDAIVASTTSTILSSDLEGLITHPSRFLNAHWLNPAYLVPLVELSPAPSTAPDATGRLKRLLEDIGKVPVVCAPAPGYIVPRIQALAMNEAARMVEDGVASVEDIDKATRYGFGFRFAILGLLEFIDWGGGDILYHASNYMSAKTGDSRYAAPAIVKRNMDEGRLGLKSGSGFLDYGGLDIPAYQREKLAEFVGLLQHMGKLPQTSGEDLVRRYLDAMERRDLDGARVLLAKDFSMTFPGGNRFSRLEELVDWARTRYRSIAKTHERFDECGEDEVTVVYCYGTLNGVWLDGEPFNGIRFIDRFEISGGLIARQDVWNDLAESAASREDV